MRIPLSRRAGFTLIELLVTVAIISILVGAVVLNIEFRNVGKSIRETAQRTGLLMQLASDQAVYSRKQFGIRFHPESYSFFILTASEDGSESEGEDGNENTGEEQTWELFEDEQLRFKSPSEVVEFSVEISGVPIVLGELVDELSEANDENPLKPHIIFVSNGEIMPDFRILIRDLDGEFEYEVTSGDLLPIVVEQLAGS